MQDSNSYALAVVRQVFNYAKRFDWYNGENPMEKIKKPSEDNRRDRFLTSEEEKILLETLKNIVRLYTTCLCCRYIPE